MRFRAPANVMLHRAQVVLILAVLVPTILTTPIGIILLVSQGSSSVAVIAGVLVLAFCASSVAGYVLGSLFLRRGASLVRVQSDFFSSVSHELRTPMTSMRMFVEALLDDRLTDEAERERCLRVLRDELERLDGLVGRLIELSKLEAGRQLFDKKRVALSEIVDSATTGFDAIKLGDETQLSVDLEPDLAVIGDKPALTQAVVNLLSNAWKYTGAHKEICLRARSNGSREVEITVHDNGPGVPANERRQVFEKFQRGRAANASATSGSGLGLAIVKAIVEAHDGQVELRSTPGKGTEVTITLPRATPGAAAESGTRAGSIG